MDDDAKKKVAKLTTCMLAQDFVPDHWEWGPSELSSLGNIAAMGHVILKRLQAAGLEVTEVHVTKHDKDEHELWNEYQNRYQVKFTSNHIHVVCKFARGKGDTLENIAEIIGIAPNFIAKPKQGKHSYDDMLAYLIHIKYPKKFQYDPNDVITIVGKEYIEYFREYHRQWMHGRSIRILTDAKVDLQDVKRMIMDGEIGTCELLTDERFKYVYQLHKEQLDKLIANHNEYERWRSPDYLEKLKNTAKRNS